MNATPRVRSGAFPQTPTTVRVGRGAPPTPSPSPPRPPGEPRPLFADPRSSRRSTSRRRSVSRRRSGSRRSSSPERRRPSTAEAVEATTPPSPPLIPLGILDAPTQRFYALAVYMGLFAWKCYDWVQLIEDHADSFWLFLKWTGIDFVFLFGLPELRIPWLELAQPAVIALFVAHVVLDYMLMFNLGLPGAAWILGFFKVFYDRELALSERYVKTDSILHNASLISGRQIINILPEGSAVLNPSGLPFCIGVGPSPSASSPTLAALPLFFNATVPVQVELIRRDLDTNAEEVLPLTRHQLREIASLVKRHQAGLVDGEPPSAVVYDVPVKKTGAYRLGRVLDEYKLDVQRPSPFSFVVACPSAHVGRRAGAPAPKPASSWSSSSSSALAAPLPRCHGDLSDLLLDVHGTPPLKIVYSRTINGKDHSFHFQSLQPEGFTSPFVGTGSSRSSSSTSSSASAGLDESELAAVTANIPTEGDVDISWARPRSVSVGLNETMHVGGEWQYAIDEVHDAFGNVARYNEPADEHQQDMRAAQQQQHQLVQSFLVRERPRVHLRGCDLRQPLKVARGRSTSLPVHYELPGVRREEDETGAAHTLTWTFSPIDSLTKSGDHGDVVVTQTHKARHAEDVPAISAPGLYTLRTVAAGACEGEVQEPSSCLLLNPLEPKLALQAEPIPDSCGGRSVGLRVDLDLVGTPPFLVRYDVSTNGVVRHEKVQVPGMRYQLELIPRVAGSHKYVFRSIDDAVYKAQTLSGPAMALEQSVKPAARATIDHPSGRVSACLQEAVGADVVLSGEAPFTLEYVLLHEGKRRAFTVDKIEAQRFRIETPPLSEGGEYTLALTSVHDRSGCRTFLQGVGGELKISVRRQRPRAAFGLLENRRRVRVVEGATVQLPLRLTGEGPWRVAYQNLDVPASPPITRTLRSGNDVLAIRDRGRYEIADVSDNQCHGVVDAAASVFEVDWFPRPELSVVHAGGIEEHKGVLVKRDICEGDIDGFEIDLKGSPPYHVEYDVRHQAPGAQTSLTHKQLDAALGRASLQMDTSRAGTYRYEFAPPADSLYNSGSVRGPASGSALVLQQTVHAKPTAVFAKAGQSFKYCMAEQDNEERIPMVLTGEPPFYVEIEIKHQSGSVAETYGVPSITTHDYDLRIPRQHLRPGTQQIRIRKVRDARGCQQKTDEALAERDRSVTKLAAATVQVQLFEAPAIYALESRTDYCVGERISYTLSGTPPFDVWYTFDGVARRGSSPTTTFRRVAEAPGELAVTAIGDGASACRAAVNLTRTVHPLPWVRVSQGRTARSDIHEGGAVEMVFEFGGTPPFEFSYTRSTNARRGQRSQVLETRHDISYEHRKVVRASQEGTYEVVAVKDKFCAFSTQRVEEK